MYIEMNDDEICYNLEINQTLSEWKLCMKINKIQSLWFWCERGRRSGLPDIKNMEKKRNREITAIAIGFSRYCVSSTQLLKRCVRCVR